MTETTWVVVYGSCVVGSICVLMEGQSTHAWFLTVTEINVLFQSCSKEDYLFLVREKYFTHVYYVLYKLHALPPAAHINYHALLLSQKV